MKYWNRKPELNKLLEEIYNKGDTNDLNVRQLIADCNAIWPEEPFAHIKNFSKSLESLKTYPIWISYGGCRTGSTFITMALKILLDSLVESFLIGWEGDFKEPIKFFELAKNTPSVNAGILKIHRSEDYCNQMLKNDMAKAVVSTRDYPSIAASYMRMIDNPYSPFYTSSRCTDEQLINFIKGEILEHKKKRDLPNTLFIKEENIRESPHEALLVIAEHMGLNLSTISAHQIGEKLNIETQRSRQKKLIINSAGHSKDNFLHHEHINPFNQKVDRELIELVFMHFGSELNESGYLI